MTMIIRWALPALVTPLLVGWPVQDAQQPIRVQTTLVSVPAIVSDASGRHVGGLRAEDFRLYDDEKAQKIDLFAANEEALNVALLLDTSKSTVAVLGKIKKAARKFLRQLRPQDRAMVIAFDEEVRALSRLTDNRKVLEEAIRAAEEGEPVRTKLRDSIVHVAEKRMKPILGRKAIVLLTDGQDNGSQATADQVVESATESGTVVYTVLYSIDPREAMRKLYGVRLPRNRSAPAPAWRELEKEASDLMEKLSNDSAGRLYRVELTDLDKTFAQIADELRHQYLLAFYPDKAKLDGTTHGLRVEVTRPGLVVRSRASYRTAS
jgi:VWFA-related protein